MAQKRLLPGSAGQGRPFRVVGAGCHPRHVHQPEPALRAEPVDLVAVQGEDLLLAGFPG
ncbi:hypothetical protein HKX69_00980 [Streptomyces argyrophyllae]|uniref:Uncharacterized protein n=1 Tax=Streptomyces argyrophylli TaxID=2726118 RepID=A0A6M4PD83_9ACTN|nr:hypothetical protein [Streptomyces argyrophyllae]QJS08284.1 hypothetical protein HKX69_00980 [Streptomyces argyrophyllae]